MQKLQVQSFGREDPLQKAMATHSSILSWESLWTEEPGRLQSMGSQKSDTTYRLNSNNILKPAFFKAYSGLESIKSKAREAIRRSLQCPDGPQSGPGWCREMMRDDGLRDVMETNGQKHGNWLEVRVEEQWNSKMTCRFLARITGQQWDSCCDGSTRRRTVLDTWNLRDPWDIHVKMANKHVNKDLLLFSH